MNLPKFARFVGLSLIVAVSALPASAAAFTSTCWLTCFSLNPGGVTNYKVFNVTKAACCSGSALSCPPGSVSGQPAWGEPAALCPFNNE